MATFLQEERIQHGLVRAAAHVRSELGERVANKDEPAIEEHSPGGGDARDGGDKGQGCLAHKVGQCRPDFGAHLANGQREVVSVASRVRHDLGQMGVRDMGIPDDVHKPVPQLDAALFARDCVAGRRVLAVDCIKEEAMDAQT